MITIPSVVAQRITELESSVSAFDPMDLASELNAMVPQGASLSESERRGCLAEVEAWRFQATRHTEREPWCSYFGPIFTGMTQSGDMVCSPDINWVTQEVADYWVARSAASAHPLFQARFADLAWEWIGYWNRSHPERKVARPRDLAQRAVDGYLATVARDLATEDHLAWLYLDRALELSLFVQDKQRIQQTKDAAFTYARSRAADIRSGHWWNLHSMFWDTKGVKLTDAERDELIGWMEKALATHTNRASKEDFNPHNATQAAELLRLWRLKQGQGDDAVKAVRTAAAAFESIAGEADAMTAIAWLEDVSAKYQRDNLHDDAARVDAGIRARANVAEESLVRNEIRYEVPAEEMEVWLKGMMGASLHEALGHIAMHFVQTEAWLEQQIQKLSAEAPFHAHMTISIMGPHGFTVAKVGSVADDMAGRKIHTASELIGHHAPWLNVVLERAREQWHLDAEKLFAWLVQDSVFLPLGHGLLKLGLKAWEDEDFVKATHLLVPQFESAIRELMLVLGESPMKLDVRAGGFESMGLGVMLVSRSLREFLDPSLLHHLRSLYTHPKGLNLRNRVAHGLASEEVLGRGTAIWVVHSLIALRVYVAMARSRKTQMDKNEVGD